jgi:hypothetical protein
LPSLMPPCHLADPDVVVMGYSVGFEKSNVR